MYNLIIELFEIFIISSFFGALVGFIVLYQKNQLTFNLLTNNINTTEDTTEDTIFLKLKRKLKEKAIELEENKIIEKEKAKNENKLTFSLLKRYISHKIKKN
jgi:hypothetical protein